MTLEQWMLNCEKAIRSNFKMRNVRVFGNESRHLRIIGERRAQVRKFVRVLRQARHPDFAPLVAEAVRWKVA